MGCGPRVAGTSRVRRDAARKSRREPPVGGCGSALSMDTRRDGSGDGAGSARAMVTICRTRSACASTKGVGGTTNRCEFPDTSSTTSVEGASVAKTEAPLATRRSVNPEPEVTSTARIAL